ERLLGTIYRIGPVPCAAATRRQALGEGRPRPPAILAPVVRGLAIHDLAFYCWTRLSWLSQPTFLSAPSSPATGSRSWSAREAWASSPAPTTSRSTAMSRSSSCLLSLPPIQGSVSAS